MSPAPTADRSAVLDRLVSAPLDVLIAGGGIVGAGIARDAALRGLRVGLVEQCDFAYGTSSRSSRLLHGGLRYLAQGRIGLVREASLEKRVIHRIAPHISAPLAFIFPTFRAAPWAQWAKWKLRIGVRLYDLLAGGRNLGKSSSLSDHELAAMVPGIRREGLTGGVRYFDGLTSDARLVVDTLRSAAAAGAWQLNYCRLTETRADASVWRCQVEDVLTGQAHRVTAHCVINATGPWAEQFADSSVQLRLTKGVHLVIDRARMNVADAVVMVDGGRILFVIPWGERIILGTTDTDHQGPPDAVFAAAEDVASILAVVNANFPGLELTPREVISTWAGLRPLIADPNGRPSDISRGHEIRNPRPGWWDVAGGKLTTYRLMAEQTVDRIQRYLERRVGPCTTADQPLLPPEEVDGVSGIIPPELTRAAVEHYCQHEWAVHLDDVMLRRAGWHYYHVGASDLAVQVADWMGEVLNWDAARRAEELRRYQDLCAVPG